jgi:hypothetical protein
MNSPVHFFYILSDSESPVYFDENHCGELRDAVQGRQQGNPGVECFAKTIVKSTRDDVASIHAIERQRRFSLVSFKEKSSTKKAIHRATQGPTDEMKCIQAALERLR